MTITYVIPGARTLDQLNEPTMDGHADENERMNCVVASLAEGLNILTGRTFDGDELKDAVYGQNYTGGMGAARFVDYCAKQGVKLSVHSGSQAFLIDTIHYQIHQNHPVILTMPSNWGTAPADPLHPGNSHVGLAVGDGPDTIRVMNPWHGFMQDATNEWWRPRLCYGQVWLMERAAGASIPPAGDFAMLDIKDTAGYFTATVPGTWHCSNGKTVSGNILDFYRANAGFRLFGLPITPELYPATGYTGRVQVFERGAIAYDPEHKWDKVPTEPDAVCYSAHIDGGFVATELQGTLKQALDAAYVTLLADAKGIEQTVDGLKKLVP